MQRLHPLTILLFFSCSLMFLRVDCYPESFHPISGELASFGLYEPGSWWAYREVNGSGARDTVHVLDDTYSPYQGIDDEQFIQDLRVQTILFRGDSITWYFEGAPWGSIWSNQEPYAYSDPGTAARYLSQTFLSTDSEGQIEVSPSAYPGVRNRIANYVQNGVDYGETLEVQVAEIDSLVPDSLLYVLDLWISRGIGVVRQDWSDGTVWELEDHAVSSPLLQP